jgi:signal-transduction protein with cAMP-binding, CBS, and nucleotidyltransferase domain
MATDLGTKLARAAGDLLGLISMLDARGMSAKEIAEMSYLLREETVQQLLADAKNAMADTPPGS